MPRKPVCRYSTVAILQAESLCKGFTGHSRIDGDGNDSAGLDRAYSWKSAHIYINSVMYKIILRA
jgi:hypothetical protein